MLSGVRPASTPSVDSITSATTAGEGRQVITMSQLRAKSAGDWAGLAPAATSWAIAFGSRSRTIVDVPLRTADESVGDSCCELKAFEWRVPLGAESICGHGASGYLAGNGLLSAFGMSFLAAESFLTKPAD